MQNALKHDLYDELLAFSAYHFVNFVLFLSNNQFFALLN